LEEIHFVYGFAMAFNDKIFCWDPVGSMIYEDMIWLGECFVCFSGWFFSMLMVFGDFNTAMLSVLLIYKIVCCFEFFGNESDVAKFGNFCSLGFLVQYGYP